MVYTIRLTPDMEKGIRYPMKHPMAQLHTKDITKVRMDILRRFCAKMVTEGLSLRPRLL